jgi:predicted oxidoreductase
LRPYPSLALFAIPVIILEPAKPLAGYLLGTGHFFLGAVTFIAAEVLKLTLVERLFQLNREKLLSIPAFAWGYRYWRDMMDVVESMEIWRASRRLVANAGHMVRTRWLQLKQARRTYPFLSVRDHN